METGALLKADQLRKRFPVTEGVALMRTVGWTHAVDGVSFEVRRGETLAIVGESGCGKTTLARLVLRLERPTSGTVALDGKDIHALAGRDLRRFRMQAQAVFQDPWSSLSPRMRVRDIVTEPLVVNRRVSGREARERAAGLLRAVGLRPEHGGLFPHEFSGGQRQRIALASALSVDPELLVLDEPVSALDASVQAQMLNLLRDLQEQRGVAYLIVSHNLPAVRYLADEVAVMYLGEFVERAKARDLYETPLHPYTKALLSSAPPPPPGAAPPSRPSSAPAPRPGAALLPPILQGEPPSPLDPPSGCRFHPRCPLAMPICSEIAPQPTEQAPNHQVACHLY